MKKKEISAAKAGFGYTIGNYCIKGIGLITVPLFSRLMSTGDFGVFNTFLAYEEFLYLFMELALHESLKGAKYKFKGRIDQYTSSVTLIISGLFLVYLGIGFFLKNPLSKMLAIPEKLILLLILYSFCAGMLIYYRYRVALDYDYQEYLKLSIFHVICSVLLSVVLMLTVYSHERFMGRIIGNVVSYSVLAAYIFIRLYKKALPRVSRDFWRYGLKIGIPIIPHGLAQIALLQFDRIMVNEIVGSAQAGLYSFAYTIYSLIQITAASLETSFSPWVFGKMEGRGNENQIQKAGTCFMLFLAGIVTVTMLVAPEVIMILGGGKYKESISCVIPVLFGGFFAMSCSISAVIEYYYEKTVYTAGGTLLAAGLNVVLNLIFIPLYGYVAAAYTTLVGYIVYFTAHTVIARRLCGFFMIRIRYLAAALCIMLCAFFTGLFCEALPAVRYVEALLLAGTGSCILVKVYGVKECRQMLRKLKDGKINERK